MNVRWRGRDCRAAMITYTVAQLRPFNLDFGLPPPRPVRDTFYCTVVATSQLPATCGHYRPRPTWRLQGQPSTIAPISWAGGIETETDTSALRPPENNNEASVSCTSVTRACRCPPENGHCTMHTQLPQFAYSLCSQCCCCYEASCGWTPFRGSYRILILKTAVYP